jgi:hypothetical protein
MRGRHPAILPAPTAGAHAIYGVFRWLAPPANVRTALRACAQRMSSRTYLRERPAPQIGVPTFATGFS